MLGDSMEKAVKIRMPCADDRPLWDVFFGIWGYPAVFVAHELKLFELLSEKPLGLDEIAAAKGIARRPAEALLAVCVSIGLIQLCGGRFSLTALGEEYMLPSSPTYFGWKFDAWRLIYSVWSPDSLRDAVLSDKPQGVFSDPAGAAQGLNYRVVRCVAPSGPSRWFRLGGQLPARWMLCRVQGMRVAEGPRRQRK